MCYKGNTDAWTSKLKWANSVKVITKSADLRWVGKRRKHSRNNSNPRSAKQSALMSTNSCNVSC